MEESIIDCAKRLRDQLREIEGQTRAMMNNSCFQGEQSYNGQHSEMKAQIMLSVRHIEDARMRLGKVCQYAGNGTSIYDKM